MRVGGEVFLLYMGFRKRLNEGGWGGFFSGDLKEKYTKNKPS